MERSRRTAEAGRQQWLRGLLELCVLGALVESDPHGFKKADDAA